VGPRAGLDATGKRKIVPQPGIEPQPSKPYSLAIPTELSRPRLLLGIFSNWRSHHANTQGIWNMNLLSAGLYGYADGLRVAGRSGCRCVGGEAGVEINLFSWCACHSVSGRLFCNVSLRKELNRNCLCMCVRTHTCTDIYMSYQTGKQCAFP
jgi:hypothetical protein